LGWELQQTLACLGQVIALDLPEVDFTKPGLLTQVIQEVDPELIINAVAYTNVDKAECEPEVARLINATSVGVIADAALHRKTPFIHFSTDYVFNGAKGSPYAETDTPEPINVYGQTKLEGEQAIQQVGGICLILRTSWVYSLRKGGFVNKVLEWSRTQKVIRVVDDQVGNPTWARMLAEATAIIIAQGKDDPTGYLSDKAGLYHLAGAGFASRFLWSQEILKNIGDKSYTSILEPAKSTEFTTPAIRPLNSSLNCDLFEATFKFMLPDWIKALEFLMSDKVMI